MGTDCEEAVSHIRAANNLKLSLVFAPSARPNADGSVAYEFAVTHTSRALLAFLQSPYWSRMWIIQEFALARDLAFASGAALATSEDVWSIFY